MKRERLKYVSIFLIVSVVLVGGWYAVYRLFNRPVEPYIRTVFTAEETAVVFDEVQWPQRDIPEGFGLLSHLAGSVHVRLFFLKEGGGG